MEVFFTVGSAQIVTHILEEVDSYFYNDDKLCKITMAVLCYHGHFDSFTVLKARLWCCVVLGLKYQIWLSRSLPFVPQLTEVFKNVMYFLDHLNCPNRLSKSAVVQECNIFTRNHPQLGVGTCLFITADVFHSNVLPMSCPYVCGFLWPQQESWKGTLKGRKEPRA